MDEYAGRVLADRYRLPLPPSDEYELVETRAFDTFSGQEVLVRQVPLPEIVEAEVLEPDGAAAQRLSGRAARKHGDPAVRRAIEAAQSAAQIPDHPRLDQVFDVFAEDGSLWIVSELVAARPLAALLAEAPLNPYRAAEIASDVLTAVRVLHAHGWTHRNITARTVLVCDDGRVVLTGLATGAAEEALCGYAPVPGPPGAYEHPASGPYPPAPGAQEPPGAPRRDVPAYDPSPPYGAQPHQPSGPPPLPSGPSAGVPAPQGTAGGASGRYSDPSSTGTSGAMPRPGTGTPGIPAPYRGNTTGAGDVRAARAGAIAAYRAGARAAARVTEEQQQRSGPVAPPGRLENPPAHQEATPTGPPPGGGDPVPDWWAGPPSFGAEPDDGDDPPAPRRAELAGIWRDGPGADASGSVPAGGSAPWGGKQPRPAEYAPEPGLPFTGRGPDPHAVVARTGDSSHPRPSGGGGSWRPGAQDALRADAQRQTGQTPALSGRTAAAGRWDEVVASGAVPAYRGPATPLAAERARQARIAIVGAVTERWAPEQAGPVHDNWQLAPPIGPATDLWALGALLFRAVQGHAPYPEENAAELVQLVCAEPPAFAEECGPLRPVVESLLRQDPTERPDFEELRGWLRSLVRSAPEPEAGQDVVQVPSIDGRLPIVRRRGELVRRRRRRGDDAGHGKHRQGKRAESVARADLAEPWYDTGGGEPRAARERPARGHGPQDSGRRPRSLGRVLLVLILLALVLALVYAVKFMPKADSQQSQRVGEAPAVSAPSVPAGGSDSGDQATARSSAPSAKDADSARPDDAAPQISDPAIDLIKGYVLRKDPEGFRIAVDKDWQRRPINDSGQVRYVGGDFTLIVVPGRDSVAANGADPLVYQRDKERELQPYRDSSWATASGLRRIDVGRQAMAEGQFTWQDSSGREVYVRNLAVVIAGHYHVIQVIGPDGQRDRVSEIYQQATTAYRSNG